MRWLGRRPLDLALSERKPDPMRGFLMTSVYAPRWWRPVRLRCVADGARSPRRIRSRSFPAVAGTRSRANRSHAGGTTATTRRSPAEHSRPGGIPWALLGARWKQGTRATTSTSAAITTRSPFLAEALRSARRSAPASITRRCDCSSDNSGSASSRLRVEALYPGLLGGVQVAWLGELGGTAAWQPSPVLQLAVTNLLATLSLQRTAIAYRFTPQGAGGQWRIDDVYVDPRMR